MIRIGIDPGVRECGVAIEWEGAEYTREAFLVRVPRSNLQVQASRMARRVANRLQGATHVHLCVEGQQIYKTEDSKGDPNDMIKVAIVAGAMLGALERYTYMDIVALPLPRTWKGNTPKAIHHERLARDFPHWVEPVAADTPKSLQHHVWDAVGLLEWHKERSNT